MKIIGAMIILVAVARDLPHEVKERAAVWAAARLPQCWTTVQEVQDYLKKQKGRR